MYKEAKNLMLNISSHEEYFADTAPETFEFSLKKMLPFAYGALEYDSGLKAMRHDMVKPKKLKEKQFWKNYFYRVHLIRQQLGLKTLDPSRINEYIN
eukprot:UN34470